jgi:hypothetical protein
MGKIFVKTHLGMGDNIVHNGMIRKIAQDNPGYQIYTAAKEHYFKNVEFMYRDNDNITVISVDGDRGMNLHLRDVKYDKIITSHFADNNSLHYETYFDDAFYMLVGIDTKVKTEYFHIDRDYDRENEVYDELITKNGITDYVFVHEKTEERILIDRNRLEPNLPVIVADRKYGIFELLKVIENAKSVNVVSSSFLSLFMCKKFNENTFAHMYCDRKFIAPYIIKNNVEVLL